MTNLTPAEATWLDEFRRSVEGDYNTLTMRVPPRILEHLEIALGVDSLMREIEGGRHFLDRLLKRGSP